LDALDSLQQRNATFATTRFVPLPLRATLNATIVTCVDPRVDPAHILGLELGEAAVIRNVGGRITPATLQELALLRRLPRGGTANAPGNLVILHHTDCGIIRLQPFPDLLADYFGIPEAQLPTKAIADPYAAVQADIALLAATPDIPGSLIVTGLVYDVATGLVEIVVPPAPLQTHAERV
jgi:carbonic anhydrase